VIVRLFGMLAMLALAWFASRVLRPRAGIPRGAKKVPPRTESRMVRDRICNTFLPRSKALVERVGNAEHFFCSEPCRRAFVSGATARTPGQSA
jgi:hypothetical protein